MNASDIVIKTTGLTKTYKGGQVLKTLDLTVNRDSICGFLGPNGAGKTTTIKLLPGLARSSSGGGQGFGLDIEKENERSAAGSATWPRIRASTGMGISRTGFHRGRPKYNDSTRPGPDHEEDT